MITLDFDESSDPLFLPLILRAGSVFRAVRRIVRRFRRRKGGRGDALTKQTSNLKRFENNGDIDTSSDPLFLPLILRAGSIFNGIRGIVRRFQKRRNGRDSLIKRYENVEDSENDEDSDSNDDEVTNGKYTFSFVVGGYVSIFFVLFCFDPYKPA